MDKKQFKDLLKHTISSEMIKVLAQKEEGKKFLSYAEAEMITHNINNIFLENIGSIPKQIDAACSLANAILAPSTAERVRLIKYVKTLATSIVGISLIILAIGSALGWGAGIIAIVTAFFAGTTLLGPIGLGILGVSLTCVAGYFYISNNEEVKTERYEKALSAGVLKAVDMIWDEYEEKLLQVKVGNKRG